MLFTTDGRIIKIDPGDQYERVVATVINQLEELPERISIERGG